MRKLFIFAWLLTLPHTVWLAGAQQNDQLRGFVSAPLAGIQEFPNWETERQGESPESDDLQILSPTSPSSTMSPTSPSPAGIRLMKKTYEDKHPNVKYSENEYDLIGFYKREDGLFIPLYRKKDVKKK